MKQLMNYQISTQYRILPSDPEDDTYYVVSFQQDEEDENADATVTIEQYDGDGDQIISNEYPLGVFAAASDIWTEILLPTIVLDDNEVALVKEGVH